MRLEVPGPGGSRDCLTNNNEEVVGEVGEAGGGGGGRGGGGALQRVQPPQWLHQAEEQDPSKTETGEEVKLY